MPLLDIGATSETVGKPCPEWLDHERNWQLNYDFTGGTKRLIESERIKDWLPPYGLEDKFDISGRAIGNSDTSSIYDLRRKSATLYGAYHKAVKNCASRALREPIQVIDAPEKLQYIEQNADGDGNPLSEVVRKLIMDGCGYGVGHLHVTVPDKPGATVSHIKDQSAVPYIVNISPLHMPGWSYSDDLGELEHIRFFERVHVRRSEDFFDIKCIDQVRVTNAPGSKGSERLGTALGTWEIWQREDGNKFVLVEWGVHSFPGIAIETLYTNRQGRMIADPPMLDLLEMNMRHFRSDSDHEQYMQFCRSASKVFRKGWDEDELKKPYITSWRNVASSEGEEAELLIVEPAGTAAEASREDLKATVEMMDSMSSSPLQSRSGNVTATSDVLHFAEADSDLQAMIEAAERTIEKTYRNMGIYMGLSESDFPETFEIKLPKDFTKGMASDIAQRYLADSTAKGMISKETNFEEGIRNGFLDPDREWDDEKERLDDEGPIGLDLFSDPEEVSSGPPASE